jgi:hypothetical protein
MILGMTLATFTMVHVIISLIAIVAGLIVMFGMGLPVPIVNGSPGCGPCRRRG